MSILQGVVPTRMMVMGARKNPTTLDYVQDGLIDMFDGIENAGRGQHDDTLVIWPSLVSTNYWARGRRSSGWSTNALLMNQTTDNTPYGGAVFRNSGGTNITIANCKTAEIILRIDQDCQFSSVGESLILTNGSTGTNFPFYETVWRYSGASYGGAPFEGFIKTSPRLYSNTVGTQGVPYSICQTLNSGTYKVYRNASQIQIAEQAESSIGVTSGYAVLSGRLNGSNNRNFTGAVFALRFYNRVLTDAEIRHNYLIDKWRFNLP